MKKIYDFFFLSIIMFCLLSLNSNMKTDKNRIEHCDDNVANSPKPSNKLPPMNKDLLKNPIPMKFRVKSTSKITLTAKINSTKANSAKKSQKSISKTHNTKPKISKPHSTKPKGKNSKHHIKKNTKPKKTKTKQNKHKKSNMKGKAYNKKH